MTTSATMTTTQKAAHKTAPKKPTPATPTPTPTTQPTPATQTQTQTKPAWSTGPVGSFSGQRAASDVDAVTADLKGILRLQRLNHLAVVSADGVDGFVTVEHTLATLRAMHAIAPSIVAWDERGVVVAYALVMPRATRSLLPILEPMFVLLEATLPPELRWYVMGQVCVADSHRGSGVFDALYADHRNSYADRFDVVVTEISQKNRRSLRAHARVGFETLLTHKDPTDTWAVVQWDWRKTPASSSSSSASSG